TDTQTIVKLPFTDNWALGSARAHKVVRYLTGRASLDPKRAKSTSCAENRPPPKTGPSQGAKMARRVEIILSTHP
ncbi:unnamed protein product, partial [marine sediment metagenome]